MKLDPSKSHYEQEWGWVAHPDGVDSGNDDMAFLAAHRYELEIIGGVRDNDASWSYDDWALTKLDGSYWLLATKGCSCPSPVETWRIEMGPATIEEIRAHIEGGHYEGYTVPKKQMDEFMALLDEAEKQDKAPERKAKVKKAKRKLH